MKMKSGFRVLSVLALGTAAVVGTPLATPVAAQSQSTECRCVDRDGNEVENCTCFRTPGVPGLVSQLTTRSERPRLGISVDAGQSARLDAEGVLVTDVLGGGPAADAGLEEGDIVIALDGQRLTESIGARAESDLDLDQSIPVQRLLALVDDLEEGQEVEVEYLRDGERQTTIVSAEALDEWSGGVFPGVSWDVDRFRDQIRDLGERARDSRLYLRRPDDSSVFLRSGSRAGVRLSEMNDGLAPYFDVDEGVLVLEADRRSGLGLRAGDVVVSIGGRAVRAPDHFHRIITSYADDEDIAMVVVRSGSEIEVVGRLRY